MSKINLKKSHIKTPYHCGDLTIKIAETLDEFRDAKWVRIKVFQQEQGISARINFDGRDGESAHIIAYLNAMPVGTTRVRKLDNGAVKIERMAVLKVFRQRGIGAQIIKYALDFIKDQRIKVVRLSSQEQVQKFYEQFGFKAMGDVFDEAKIRHIMMEKKL